MAYKHDVEAKPVHSMQPSHLIEAIVRERIFHSAYWKEQCFGINAADIAKRAVALTYVGGTFGANCKPAPFLCLVLKMLMVQPENEIIAAFIGEKDFRYVRLLGLFYMRLVGSSEEIYKICEAAYSDNRKFKYRQPDGSFTIEYVDDFADQLLHQKRVCATTLPPLLLRHVLVGRTVLAPRVSFHDSALAENSDRPEKGDVHFDSVQEQEPKAKLPRFES